MSFGTELNGFVNGANDFDPSKSAIFFDQPILAPPTVFGDVDKVEAVDSHFQVFLLPFLVPLKKVKKKSQLCALHVTNTPATQTYVWQKYVYELNLSSKHSDQCETTFDIVASVFITSYTQR